MNKYKFDPDRCKAAFEKISRVLLPYGKWAEQALDDLAMDIEALHTAAQERDAIVDGIAELSNVIDVHDFDTYFGWCWDDEHVDENGKRICIADLNL